MAWELVLIGDGRKMLEPPEGAIGANPIKVSKSTARQICESFLLTGWSTHSAQGGTVWLILAYCEMAGIAYDMQVRPGLGYYIKRVETKHG